MRKEPVEIRQQGIDALTAADPGERSPPSTRQMRTLPRNHLPLRRISPVPSSAWHNRAADQLRHGGGTGAPTRQRKCVLRWRNGPRASRRSTVLRAGAQRSLSGSCSRVPYDGCYSIAHRAVPRATCWRSHRHSTLPHQPERHDLRQRIGHRRDQSRTGSAGGVRDKRGVRLHPGD